MIKKIQKVAGNAAAVVLIFIFFLMFCTFVLSRYEGIPK